MSDAHRAVNDQLGAGTHSSLQKTTRENGKGRSLCKMIVNGYIIRIFFVYEVLLNDGSHNRMQAGKEQLDRISRG